MKPYLSQTGKYLLYSGLVLIACGVFFRSPALVFIGEIEIGIVVLGVLLLIPGALALDRRRIRIELDREVIDLFGTSYRVGEEAETTIRIINASNTPLYGFSAKPFGSKSLLLPETLGNITLSADAEVPVRFPVKGLRTGRFVIHGYDVCVRDPLGITEVKDYLPNIESFRFFPQAGRFLRKGLRFSSLFDVMDGSHSLRESGNSTSLKELRDFQPGDAMRKIAWKQSMRTHKLISREFESESSTEVYLGLDISSSMRGGAWDGQKLEWAIHYVVNLAERVLENHDNVGLMSFDEKLYGHIDTGNSKSHMKRILEHLMGLYSIVDSEMTELPEDELESFLCDYLLVQERLDFRLRLPDGTRDVNRPLLEHWLSSKLEEEGDAFDGELLSTGIITPLKSKLRQFLQSRGVEIPYRVEARLGMKEKGVLAIFDTLKTNRKKPLWVVIISDLCGVLNPEVLLRELMIARKYGHRIRFIVPFTPAFYDLSGAEDRECIVHELFTIAEAEERDKIILALRSVGVEVDYIKEGRKEIKPFLQDPFLDDFLLDS